MLYNVYTGMHNGALKTVLVYEPEEEDSPIDYFLAGTTDVKDHGTVEIAGDAEDMVPEVLMGE